MRRVLSTLFMVVAVSGGLGTAFIVTAAPEASAAVTRPGPSPQVNSDIKCSSSGNACEEVVNYAQGSDYVYYVEVWDNNDTQFNGTYRLLFDGSVRYSTGSNGPAVFNLDYYVNSGKCIQGGIVGLSDARTPCWNAP
jgi:hypothetical protein